MLRMEYAWGGLVLRRTSASGCVHAKDGICYLSQWADALSQEYAVTSLSPSLSRARALSLSLSACPVLVPRGTMMPNTRRETRLREVAGMFLMEDALVST